MPITRRQSYSDLAKVSQSESLSERSKFSTGDPPIMSHGNIFPPPTPADKRTEKLVARLNKMNLDLHPTPNELVNLPQENVDDLAGGLNHDVEIAEQYTTWKNTEARELRKMEEDVGRLKANSEELNRDKERLRKKLDLTRKELTQTRKRLVNSRAEYTAMEKELKRVREDLLATQAQLDERSMPGPSQEQEHAQRLELLDELQEVNKENSILRKQLAGGSVASVAADPVASYRPCGIGPKNQLTGTDPTAYTP